LNDKSEFVARETTVNVPTAVSLYHFDFFEPLPIHIEASEAPLTSDAGLLPLRQFDESIGLTKQFAAVLDDPRDPELTEHTFLEMVRSRVFGILAGYEDQNDHDTLRTDPVSSSSSPTAAPRTTTWPASPRCPASRTRSTSPRRNDCARCSSSSSSPLSRSGGCR
jgi:hypothetical protein